MVPPFATEPRLHAREVGNADQERAAGADPVRDPRQRLDGAIEMLEDVPQRDGVERLRPDRRLVDRRVPQWDADRRGRLDAPGRGLDALCVVAGGAGGGHEPSSPRAHVEQPRRDGGERAQQRQRAAIKRLQQGPDQGVESRLPRAIGAEFVQALRRGSEGYRRPARRAAAQREPGPAKRRLARGNRSPPDQLAAAGRAPNALKVSIGWHRGESRRQSRNAHYNRPRRWPAPAPTRYCVVESSWASGSCHPCLTCCSRSAIAFHASSSETIRNTWRHGCPQRASRPPGDCGRASRAHRHPAASMSAS